MSRFAGIALALLSCASYSHSATDTSNDVPPEVVVFKNGDVLRGKVASADSVKVVFSNPSVNTLSLKWVDLKSVEIHHKVRIFSSAKPREIENATMTVASAASTLNLRIQELGGGNAFTLEDVTQLGVPAPVPWLQQFTINTAFVTSTQHQQTYGAKVVLLHTWHPDVLGWPRERTRVELLPSYDEKRKNSSPGAATITEDYFGRLQQMFFILGDKFYATATADLFRNNSLGVYFQQGYGGGVGTLLNGLELDADVRFIGEHFYNVSPSLGLVGTELEQRYSFVLGKGITLSESGVFLPVFNADRAWQAKGVVDLRIPFTPKWGFSIGLADNYIENAPPTFRKNYLKTTVGLGYSPSGKP